MSLRGRLFVALMASLALTLLLTIAIGAIITRQQVDRSQASALARQADSAAAARRASPDYRVSNIVSGGVTTIVGLRPSLAGYVPDVSRSSNGTTTYDAKTYLYSYRTIPARGLLLLRPVAGALDQFEAAHVRAGFGSHHLGRARRLVDAPVAQA